MTLERYEHLPEPSLQIVEVYKILADKGFKVEQIAYVDDEKREAIHAVIETVERPDYSDATQIYYHPNEDPLAKILERGRREKRIAVLTSTEYMTTEHIPPTSRLGVSWGEVHRFVTSEVIKTTPHLEGIVNEGNISLRVPTRREFQDAGKKYPHFGKANSWEWLYDKSEFGYYLVGGYRIRGGLMAVNDWPSSYHYDRLGFRLQAVSRPQKLS